MPHVNRRRCTSGCFSNNGCVLACCRLRAAGAHCVGANSDWNDWIKRQTTNPTTTTTHQLRQRRTRLAPRPFRQRKHTAMFASLCLSLPARVDTMWAVFAFVSSASSPPPPPSLSRPLLAGSLAPPHTYHMCPSLYSQSLREDATRLAISSLSHTFVFSCGLRTS